MFVVLVDSINLIKSKTWHIYIIKPLWKSVYMPDVIGSMNSDICNEFLLIDI